MYRDIPITPDSRCSVHSKVTCNRTSFFFDAAVTTSAPREFELARWCADEVVALNADVLAMEVRAASMAAAGYDVAGRCDVIRALRAADVSIVTDFTVFVAWTMVRPIVRPLDVDVVVV